MWTIPTMIKNLRNGNPRKAEGKRIRTFSTSSRVVMQAIVTLRSTTGEMISRIARSIATGTILHFPKRVRSQERYTHNLHPWWNFFEFSTTWPRTCVVEPEDPILPTSDSPPDNQQGSEWTSTPALTTNTSFFRICSPFSFFGDDKGCHPNSKFHDKYYNYSLIHPFTSRRTNGNKTSRDETKQSLSRSCSLSSRQFFLTVKLFHSVIIVQ